MLDGRTDGGRTDGRKKDGPFAASLLHHSLLLTSKTVSWHHRTFTFITSISSPRNPHCLLIDSTHSLRRQLESHWLQSAECGGGSGRKRRHCRHRSADPQQQQQQGLSVSQSVIWSVSLSVPEDQDSSSSHPEVVCQSVSRARPK